MLASRNRITMKQIYLFIYLFIHLFTKIDNNKKYATKI